MQKEHELQTVINTRAKEERNVKKRADYIAAGVTVRRAQGATRAPGVEDAPPDVI